jgi:uncharacterized protein (DUF433 family)
MALAARKSEVGIACVGLSSSLATTAASSARRRKLHLHEYERMRSISSFADMGWPKICSAATYGVPKSTVHWWARNEILVPSVSAERIKLWSYADLMGLRVIYWLRQRKTTDVGGDEALLDLVLPFQTREGTRGPDLVRPRPDLRIVPGKLGGSPHVVGTRNETCAIAALAKDDFDADGILSLYPHLTRDQIEQAIDLERQLDANLDKAAA